MSDTPASRMLQTLQSDSAGVAHQFVPPSQVQSTIQTDDPSASSDPSLTSPSTGDVVTTLSDQQKLATFEAVMNELEAEKSQPAAATNTPQFLSGGLAKEQLNTLPSQELPGGMQQVELEPDPEVPPELESYLQKVQEDTAHIPEEIVIAAQTQSTQSEQPPLPQDVKMLPITRQQAEEGKKKNTSFSIRWLVTFSQKIVNMFHGKAVYRTD